jgi:hypothetical protein
MVQIDYKNYNILIAEINKNFGPLMDRGSMNCVSCNFFDPHMN